jgi:hypothetical protein
LKIRVALQAVKKSCGLKEGDFAFFGGISGSFNGWIYFQEPYYA